MNIKIFTWILGLSAFFIAGNAAFFSITGIAYLFSGSFWPVVMMAGSLELGKLVSASFLYRYWDKINNLLKIYMLVGIILLVGITSMGIFGYLSKASQGATVSIERIYTKQTAYEEELKVSREDKKYLTEELQIQIKELPENYITAKRNLRQTYNIQIANKAKQISKILEQLNILKLTLIDSGVDAGPILYIAKAFGTTIDTVSKWIILVLIVVFDPLALALIIAFNVAIEKGIEKPTPSVVQKLKRRKTYEDNKPKNSSLEEPVAKNPTLRSKKKNNPDDTPADWVTHYPDQL